MRNSALVKSRFFMAGTGRKLVAEHGHRVAFTALYLVACPHSHMSGIYYLPPGTAAHELCVTADQFLADIAILESEGFARFDSGACVVWVVTMLRHQISADWKAGDKRMRTILGHLDALPDSPLIEVFRRHYGLSEGASHAPSEGASHAPCHGGPNPLPVPMPSPSPPKAASRTRNDESGADAIIARFLGPEAADGQVLPSAGTRRGGCL
ncbi:hypothetical protein [uncultured Thiodictyon sp.]|uniref:hypothetical protein n=1 Tax=uncultured Thiodictyon sp. TaxID=1846217 RepID=UPI0025E22BDF|nr:hypothetical protein [uncultured Thiodictyon sp.]